MTYEEWLAKRIESVPGRCGGRPVFKGTRLWVAVVGDVARHHGSWHAVELYPDVVSQEDALFAAEFQRRRDPNLEGSYGGKALPDGPSRALARMRTLLVLRSGDAVSRDHALEDADVLEEALNEWEAAEQLLAAATWFDFGGYVALRIVPSPPADAEVWRVRDPKGYDIEPRIVNGEYVCDYTRDEAIATARKLGGGA